ncbi:hypothetical protein ACFOD1_11045 [Pseudidiomarina halophila]|uniref:Integral membrane protein n=1 Tax=Pseudidiomarina halophila TaxID=1449799 RepID=A0A432Y0F6_9GAMM|nr:hypothetical protein [Pseudidiomarina halophila]RUO54433.1 hypothetical protein CWI69_03195 [Pseudidiomarina halophila]
MQDSNPKDSQSQATTQDNFAAALRGEVPLRVGDVIQRSWDITLRALPIMLLGMVILFLANWVISSISAQFFPVEEETFNLVNISGQSILSGLLIAPFTAIMTLMGLQNARDKKPTVATITTALSYAPKMIAVAAILMTLMAIPGVLLFLLFGSSGTFFALFVLIAIYLQLSFTLATPLILERQLSVSRAIFASVLILNKQMLPLIAIYAIFTIIVIISALPLLLGLIFTIPMSFNVIGVIYNRLIGVPEETTTIETTVTEES